MDHTTMQVGIRESLESMVKGYDRCTNVPEECASMRPRGKAVDRQREKALENLQTPHTDRMTER